MALSITFISTPTFNDTDPAGTSKEVLVDVRGAEPVSNTTVNYPVSAEYEGESISKDLPVLFKATQGSPVVTAVGDAAVSITIGPDYFQPSADDPDYYRFTATVTKL